MHKSDVVNLISCINTKACVNVLPFVLFYLSFIVRIMGTCIRKMPELERFYTSN